LEKWISTSVSGKTGVVSFTVEARSRWLALGIANRTLEVLNDFNVHRRQTQAGAERRFVEGRLAELKDELHAAEDKVQRFLQQNREFRNSPPLLFEYERLQREVATRQAIYTTLAESYERARINEVRDTPAITVLQAPRLPLLPQSRRLVLKSVLAG